MKRDFFITFRMIYADFCASNDLREVALCIVVLSVKYSVYIHSTLPLCICHIRSHCLNQGPPVGLISYHRLSWANMILYDIISCCMILYDIIPLYDTI